MNHRALSMIGIALALGALPLDRPAPKTKPKFTDARKAEVEAKRAAKLARRAARAHS